MNEHGIAEREEAVALGNGVLVGAHNIFAGREGADQHKKR